MSTNNYDEAENQAFISERFRRETIRQDKYKAFDKFIDLALDGVVTMPEAIQAYREQQEGKQKAAPGFKAA